MRKPIIISALLILLVAGAVLVPRLVSKNDTSNTDQKNIQKKYLALGGSVASGDGLSSAYDSSACNRSELGYPAVIAATYNLALTFAACSGATIDSGIVGSQTVNGAALSPQKSFLGTASAPDYITLTIGANDVGWAGFITKCLIAYCGDDSDTVALNEKLSQLSTKLSQLLSDMSSQVYGPKSPQIIVSGYYDIYPKDVSACASAPPLSREKINWINTSTTQLNLTIKSAASAFNNITYVEPSFSGHELCATDPWVQNIDEKAPFHPNESGQNALAKQIFGEPR